MTKCQRVRENVFVTERGFRIGIVIVEAELLFVIPELRYKGKRTSGCHRTSLQIRPIS